MPKTICMDFDGVIHSYTSGWKGADVIPDPPVPGAAEFMIWGLEQGFEMVVSSARCEHELGAWAIEEFLRDHGIPFTRVARKKPPALLYVDDRGFRFGGDFEALKSFVEEEGAMAPWNKRGVRGE